MVYVSQEIVACCSTLYWYVVTTYVNCKTHVNVLTDDNTTNRLLLLTVPSDGK